MFRELNEKEIKEFEQWAIDQFYPGIFINTLWHPVVQNKLSQLQTEHDSTLCLLQTETN